MKTLVALVIAAMIVLTSCGGGGSEGSSEVAAVRGSTYNVQAAYIGYVTDTKSYQFSIEGTASGINVTGSGVITQSALIDSSYNDKPARKKSITLEGNLSAGTRSVRLYSYSDRFFDSTFRFFGREIPVTEYTIVNSTTPLPAAARIGDSGVWYTETLYSLCRNNGCSKAHTPVTITDGVNVYAVADPVIGSYETKYLLEAGSADTALITVTTTKRSVAGATLGVYTSVYRISPAGSLTYLQERQSESGAELTLTIKN